MCTTGGTKTLDLSDELVLCDCRITRVLLFFHKGGCTTNREGVSSSLNALYHVLMPVSDASLVSELDARPRPNMAQRVETVTITPSSTRQTRRRGAS